MNEALRVIKEKILSKVYSTKLVGAQLSKKHKSNVWDKFEHIYDEGDRVIKNHYCCCQCKTIIAVNIGRDGNNSLRRHKCVILSESNRNQSLITSHCVRSGSAEVFIDAADKKKVKQSSYNFIVNDVRPFQTISGEGLAGLLAIFTFIGAKYGKLTPEQVTELLPHRITVSSILYVHFQINCSSQ